MITPDTYVGRSPEAVEATGILVDAGLGRHVPVPRAAG
jgi:hypothetical protein